MLYFYGESKLEWLEESTTWYDGDDNLNYFNEKKDDSLCEKST